MHRGAPPHQLLTLDQQTQRREWAYRPKLIFRKAAGHQRHCIDCRFGFFDRVSGHEENRPGVRAEPELLNSAIEI